MIPSTPIIYNNAIYELPSSLVMSSYNPNCDNKCSNGCQKCNKNLNTYYLNPCHTNFSNANPCNTSQCNYNPFNVSPCNFPYLNYTNCNPYFFTIYSLQLTKISFNNYTFIITTIEQNPKQIASGTAYQIGNILFLTFLDNDILIGSGTIEFKNFNYCRQGIVTLQGCIKNIFPKCYIVNPSN